jgi:hypothetical protein
MEHLLLTNGYPSPTRFPYGVTSRSILDHFYACAPTAHAYKQGGDTLITLRPSGRSLSGQNVNGV